MKKIWKNCGGFVSLLMLWLGISALPVATFAAETTSTATVSQKMYRLYNRGSGEHFYTNSQAERANLIKLGWKNEGVGWMAPTAGKPVYRLYNKNAGDHHYTLEGGEKDALVKKGWQYEGIGWYSDANETLPLYRAYNPQAKAGSHNYTTSLGEQNQLIAVGWKDEGVAWYANAAVDPNEPENIIPPEPVTPTGVYSRLATPYKFENFGANNWSSRGSQKITTIVVHHTAITDFDEMPDIWQKRQASAHYGIGQEGEIRAYVGEDKAAWHCGSGNSYSIGIECTNTTGAPDWLVSDKTVDALVDLIKEIQSRRGPLEIVGHRDVPGNTTTTICPGPSLYPRLQEIRDRVN